MMNHLRNICQPTITGIPFTTWPVTGAKFTLVRHYTSGKQTYAYMTARYSFQSGQSFYVHYWSHTQKHLSTHSVTSCLLQGSVPVMMVLYSHSLYFTNLLWIYLVSSVQQCLLSHSLEHITFKILEKESLPPFGYAVHTDFSSMLPVIINVCYILLVGNVSENDGWIMH
jgi:hypothetical protein